MKKFFTIFLIAACVSAAAASWYEYRTPVTTKDINAVKVLAANNVWAVGFWGEILHFDGQFWTISYTWPTSFLQDVDFSNPAFGFAVGAGGTGIRFDGSQWVGAWIPSTYDFYAVGIPVGQTNVAWAAGAGGQLWKWEKDLWTRTVLPTSRNLHDLYWSSASDGWLCGDYGTVYHYINNAWAAVPTFATANFYAIYALAPTNVWVGGSGGRLYHYEGITWVPVATPTANAIREMWFQSPTAGWAVCDRGTVLHYDGIAWSTVATRPGTKYDFSGLGMASPSLGWAVGKYGTIFNYRNDDAVELSSLGRVKAIFR